MRVAVVGAGLAGLACAVDLARAGVDTAAEFCGTMEGALRSGARAASEVLAEARSNG